MSDTWRANAPEPGAPRSFEFPAVHGRTLANGMRVVHARHGRLPLVTAHLVIDAGAATEPTDRGGLAQLMSSALHAGTGQRDANELAWEFEKIGVQLDTDVTWDAIEATITPPAASLGDALTLLADVVRNSTFPGNEVRRLREEQLAEILQHMKEPRAQRRRRPVHVRARRAVRAAADRNRQFRGRDHRLRLALVSSDPLHTGKLHARPRRRPVRR